MTHAHITIKGRLPGYNELTIGHWRKCHRIKSDAMELVMWECKLQKVKPIGHAQIKITCYEPNKKRDPSNVRAGAEKIILDALQNMGIIQNDNWKWLEDFPATVAVDCDNPRIEIELRSIE